MFPPGWCFGAAEGAQPMTTKVASESDKSGDALTELRADLEAFAADTGYRYYTYVSGRLVGGRRVTSFDPRKRPLHMSNVPDDWQSAYFANKYCDHDPVWLFALGNLLPERWSHIAERLDMTAKQRGVMNLSGDAGLRDGVIIPVHGPGGEFAVLSLSHSESAAHARHNVELDEAVLHMFALRFHTRVRALDLPADAQLPPELTRREVDVMQWTAEGKSSWDISQILGISESTVNFHISSAKRKLGVYSKPHAVAKMFSFRTRKLI